MMQGFINGDPGDRSRDEGDGPDGRARSAGAARRGRGVDVLGPRVVGVGRVDARRRRERLSLIRRRRKVEPMTEKRDFLSTALELAALEQARCRRVGAAVPTRVQRRRLLQRSSPIEWATMTPPPAPPQRARGDGSRAARRACDRDQAGCAVRSVARVARATHHRVARPDPRRDAALRHPGRERRRRVVPTLGRQRDRSRGRAPAAAQRPRGERSTVGASRR